MSLTFDFDPPAPPKPTRPAGERDIYSVSRLNKEVRLLLESGLPMLWLEGEISNFAAPASGHWYFSLKDSQAQVRCAMWRQRNSALRFRPKEGMQVVARARVGLYEPRGEYQLIIEHLEESGEGALKREFEKLKAKLAAEGLFAVERNVKLLHDGLLPFPDIVDIDVKQSPVHHVAEQIFAFQVRNGITLILISSDNGVALVVIVFGDGVIETVSFVIRGQRVEPPCVFLQIDHEASFTQGPSVVVSRQNEIQLFYLVLANV